MQCRGRPERQPEIGSDEILAWRTRRLLSAGFAPVLAAEIAADCGFDLHALLELTDRGCAPELAARIVAPLDGDHVPC
jgi:hypothetical protein